MKYSENYEFSLPYKADNDPADIDLLSENFRLIDEILKEHEGFLGNNVKVLEKNEVTLETLPSEIPLGASVCFVDTGKFVNGVYEIGVLKSYNSGDENQLYQITQIWYGLDRPMQRKSYKQIGSTSTTHIWEDWFEYAAVSDIEQEVVSALQQAKESGEFDGADGKDGAAGADGQDGANGLSAYQIWLQQGNTGSEADFLESLKGADGATGADGYTPQKGVDYWTDEDKAEINADNIAFITTELAKRGQLKPEFANDVDELESSGDTSKLYVLPDGYIWAFMLTEVTTGSTYKNILDTATVNLNSRYNSSNTLRTGATGYIAIDYVEVKNGDVIRFKPSTLPQGDASGYQRLRCYNSSDTLVSLADTKLNEEYTVTVSDDVAELTIPTSSTSQASYQGVAKMRMNLFVAAKTLTEVDLDGVVITINEEIKEGGTTTAYAWTNTGRAFVPADYEDRIIDLEGKVETLESENEDLKNQLENKGNNTLSVAEVFAPSPQLPADGSSTADFNAETVTSDEIFAYIDALASKYPKYVTKETMGKDASGNYDWNRYTLCRRYYDAWQKVNYPKMYAWINGSTTIYSVSVSPRIGDTLYTTTYIGTAKGTVTAVNNANQTRTVGGVVYTRDKTKDVEPTLVYTQTAYNPYKSSMFTTVYNSDKSVHSTISTYSTTEMTDKKGNSYIRYPFGDRDSEFKKQQVIVIGSNEHGRPGDPAEPAIISARMIKDLCECINANNPFLNLLKNNYMVIFCPVINPYGLTKNTYENANSINLDRNFDTVGWGNDTTSGLQGDYGGSENETQYFMNTLAESKPIVATANHALGSQLNASTGESVNAGMCHWMLGRNDSKYTEQLNSIGTVMGSNYNLAFTDYGEAPPENHAKTRSYIASVGAEGGAVEMQAREGFILAGEGNLHTSRILEADYTLLLQFLSMLIDKKEA